MQTVKVKRTELLEALQKNRESHRKIFDRAQVGYRKAAVDALDQMLAEARARWAICDELPSLQFSPYASLQVHRLARIAAPFPLPRA